MLYCTVVRTVQYIYIYGIIIYQIPSPALLGGSKLVIEVNHYSIPSLAYDYSCTQASCTRAIFFILLFKLPFKALCRMGIFWFNSQQHVKHFAYFTFKSCNLIGFSSSFLIVP